jgi:DNA polymerase lambda
LVYIFQPNFAWSEILFAACLVHQEARQLQGVGDKLADHIYEIIETGNLQRAKIMGSSDFVQATTLFAEIWGVGASVAEQWFNKGWRTLDDVRANVDSLTRQQAIGLKHYKDFCERIPRDEAAEIEATVCSAIPN